MELDSLIEAILFFKGEPVKIKKLAEWTDSTESQITDVITVLKQKLSDRGIVLLTKDGEISLGTSPLAGSFIERITKEEFSKELGKSALETLAIIVYKAPVSRPEIDYIRGVNSSFILRNLMIRGLIEREVGADKRSYVYKPTFELLSYLGITELDQMPEYDTVADKIASFMQNQEKDDNEKN